MNFETFNFHPSIAAGAAAAGYETPTPIQARAIPQVIKGRDIMGLAQTGTGKTAAFVLPILNRLVERKYGCVRALIIAPTRELAEQIHQAIETLGRETHIRSVSVYGGVGINPQIKKLKRADIVVACPGRLLDHIGRHSIDLSQLEVLVIDEADQMLDMGFIPDIRRILKNLPKKHQTLVFSATMPVEIRRLAGDILRNPDTVQVGITAPADTVSHALYPVAQHLKTALLLKLLGNTHTKSVLVFTRTKHRAKSLGKKLAAAGHRSASLQGNLSQTRRQAALDGFRDGHFGFWWLPISPLAALTLPGFLMSSTMISLPPPRHTFTASDGQAGQLAAARLLHLLPKKTRLWCAPSIESSDLKLSSVSYQLLTTNHPCPIVRAAPGG